jgi:hypothetical protein
MRWVLDMTKSASKLKTKNWLKQHPFSTMERQFKLSKWMRYEDKICLYYWPSLYEWMRSKPRKPANMAFTAGLARNIAELIEEEHSRDLEACSLHQGQGNSKREET